MGAESFSPVGLALGGIAAVGKLGLGIFQNIKAGKIHPQWNAYQTSPYAQSQLGLAQQLYNGRMAGASNIEQNIYANQAGQMANINRNAASGSQALALGAATQGQADQSFNNLGVQEAQNKYGLLSNLNAAYDAMSREHDKDYQSKLMKYQMDTQEKSALRGAGIGNMFGAFSDASSMAMLNYDQKNKKQQDGGEAITNWY